MKDNIIRFAVFHHHVLYHQIEYPKRLWGIAEIDESSEKLFHNNASALNKAHISFSVIMDGDKTTLVVSEDNLAKAQSLISA